MKEKKNLIIILILLVGVVGITIAYFSNTTSIDNLFSTKKYGSTITEEFISPDSWLPGDETSKSIVATNTGEVDQAVRISYTEKWLDSNNNELNGWIHEDGSKSSHETEEELSSDERVAVINFDNNDDWTYNNGYYYYNYRLQPNESTSSLIRSVTFNSKTKLDDTCETTISDGKKTITCNSSGSDYDNAKYTLTFKIETVQFNKYMNAWNTDVAILEEQALFCDAFEVGEVVTYNNAEYYVLKDSSTSDDYVTLLKKDPLTAEEVNTYSTDYISQDGEYPYFESDTCNENIQTGCSTNYDTSSVKKIIDGWSSNFLDDLVVISGQKVRIVGDLDSAFYQHDSYGRLEILTTSYLNSYYYNKNKCWTSSTLEDSNTEVVSLARTSDATNVEKVYNKLYIRPIINLKKSVIDGTCSVRSSNEYFACDKGDRIEYDNETYYVIENSDSSKKYVTVLRDKILTAEEINTYSTDYVSIDGKYPFYMSDNCNENNQSGCYSEVYSSEPYNKSFIQKLLDNWGSQYSKDLVNINGGKAILPNRYSLNNMDLPYSNNKYWTGSIPAPYCVYTIYGDTLICDREYNKNYIKPAINLKKDAIESGCHIGNNSNNTKYTTYSIGETISYNNSNYCVISNSSNKSDYVTLIKQEPLTYDELVTYNNGYELGRDSVDNNSGIISYYKSDSCYYNSDSDKNTAGCSNDYNNSFIKNILNNWSNSFNNDLEEDNGYKVRLITNSELHNMGHVYTLINSSATSFTKSDYDCLYSDADYWTMSSSSDSTYKSNIVSKIDNNNGPQYIDKKYAVRPVINLKKCAIDNTCE